jgi:hypothetical protein
MGIIFLVLGVASLTGGVVLLMPYSYAWMERIGWPRRWAYGLALIGLGIGFLLAGGAVS